MTARTPPSDTSPAALWPARRVKAMTDVDVLVMVGISPGSVDRELIQLAAETKSDEITVNVFNELGDLPSYSETSEGRRTPHAVNALRIAAAEADSLLVTMNYWAVYGSFWGAS
jgi:hypothetical protein